MHIQFVLLQSSPRKMILGCSFKAAFTAFITCVSFNSGTFLRTRLTRRVGFVVLMMTFFLPQAGLFSTVVLFFIPCDDVEATAALLSGVEVIAPVVFTSNAALAFLGGMFLFSSRLRFVINFFLRFLCLLSLLRLPDLSRCCCCWRLQGTPLSR